MRKKIDTPAVSVSSHPQQREGRETNFHRHLDIYTASCSIGSQSSRVPNQSNEISFFISFLFYLLYVQQPLWSRSCKCNCAHTRDSLLLQPLHTNFSSLVRTGNFAFLISAERWRRIAATDVALGSLTARVGNGFRAANGICIPRSRNRNV